MIPFNVGCIEPVGILNGCKKIGTNADRDDDRDENHFDILAPVRFPGHRGELVQFGVELFGPAFDLLVDRAASAPRAGAAIIAADFVAASPCSSTSRL